MDHLKEPMKMCLLLSLWGSSTLTLPASRIERAAATFLEMTAFEESQKPGLRPPATVLHTSLQTLWPQATHSTSVQPQSILASENLSLRQCTWANDRHHNPTNTDPSDPSTQQTSTGVYCLLPGLGAHYWGARRAKQSTYIQSSVVYFGGMKQALLESQDGS